MLIPILLSVTLALILLAALYKIRILRRGYDELTENIKDQVSGKTGIPIALTTDRKSVV